jgi:hypothetical protein
VATETDAARDRVLAARAALGDELDALEASARAAIDIPAKIKRSPAKAAAVAGSAGFLALGGPKRLLRAANRAVRGPTASLPKRMLPDEIEKTLRGLGEDGDKVRGTLERDFAAYTKQASKERAGVAALLATTVGQPLMRRGLKAATDWFLRPDEAGFAARLAEVRERATREMAKRREGEAADREATGTRAPAEPRPGATTTRSDTAGSDDSGAAGAEPRR